MRSAGLRTGDAGKCRHERSTAAVFVLALQRGLSRAHRPEPQGPAVRNRAGAPAARRRRAAHAERSATSTRRGWCRCCSTAIACCGSRWRSSNTSTKPGPTPPLLPATARDRQRVRALAQAIACDIHPLNNLRVLQYFEHEWHVPQPERDGWVRHWISEGFAAFEAMLADHPSTGQYLRRRHADHGRLLPGPAGLQRAPLRRGHRAFPTIARIEAGCLALPAFDAGAPGDAAGRAGEREQSGSADRPHRGRPCADQRVSQPRASGGEHVRVGIVLAAAAFGQAELQGQAVARVGRAQRLLRLDPAFLVQAEQALVEASPCLLPATLPSPA